MARQSSFTSLTGANVAAGDTFPVLDISDTTMAATGTNKQISLNELREAIFSAGQIKFPATQNASSDVNTLDDYEEGTWTPALTFATPGTLSITYTVQSGLYTKIGRAVTVEGYILIATNGFTKGTASGQLALTGLPFATNAATNSYFYLDLAVNSTDFTASTLVLAAVSASSTSLLFEKVIVSGALIRRDSATLNADSFASTNANGVISLGFRLTYSV